MAIDEALDNLKISEPELIEKLEGTNAPIIIFGAGIVGEVLLEICQTHNIKIKSFCDNNKKLKGTTLCALDVLFAPDLSSQSKDTIFLISATAAKECTQQLKDMGFENCFLAFPLLESFSLENDLSGFPTEEKGRIMLALDTCINAQKAYLEPEKLFLKSIDLMITERCSLKCRHCSNLMQYYQDPQHCELDTLFESMERFLTLVDEVVEVRLLGGEAFLNKDWTVISEKILESAKVKKLVIYTNGTFVPPSSQLPYLKQKGMFVYISDYGKLSKRMDALIELLETHDVNYWVSPISNWTNCAEIHQHNRSDQENTMLYSDCCVKDLVTLSDGKIFNCPFAANAHRLSAVPEFKSDYIDLFAEDLTSAAAIKDAQARLKEYLLNKDFLKTCDFCNGRTRSADEGELEPAVQTKEILSYKKYV